MTVAIVIAVAGLIIALVTAVALAVHARRQPEDHLRNGSDNFVAWDWPPRPINGHDHPEPPELEREPTA